MLNKFGKFLIIVLMFGFFALIPMQSAVASRGGIPVMNEETTDNLTVDNNLKVKDLDIDPINTDKVKKSVVPDTRQEGRKLMGLFFKTMLLVVICGCFIYLVLFVVRKFYKSSFIPTDEEYENVEMLELITPETKNEALKSFLNRTK